MATTEILGYTKVIRHQKNTNFDHIHTVSTINPETKVESAFFDSLVDYTHTFKIYEGVDKNGPIGTAIYSKTDTDPEITITATTIRIKDKINLTKIGSMYYEAIMTHKTDALKVFKYWFGIWENVR